MMSKVVFWITISISVIPFLIGLILTSILCIIPFSIRSKSVKGGFSDCISMFHELKDLMI